MPGFPCLVDTLEKGYFYFLCRNVNMCCGPLLDVSRTTCGPQPMVYTNMFASYQMKIIFFSKFQKLVFGPIIPKENELENLYTVSSTLKPPSKSYHLTKETDELSPKLSNLNLKLKHHFVWSGMDFRNSLGFGR